MGKGSCCPKLGANLAFTVYRLVQVRGGGRGGGGWGANKVPGLTLIVHNLEMNKYKFTNPANFQKFNRINSLLSFPLKIDVSTTTSFSMMKNGKKVVQSFFTSFDERSCSIFAGFIANLST